MPYKFVFKVGNNEYFSANVESFQCQEQTRAGHQCTRTTVIGSPYCYTHLLYIHRLRIKKSTIPNAGKGLFAMTGRPGNEILFREEDTICEYHGEVIDKDTLDERYGEFTAPYAVEVNEDRFIDSSTARGVGSLANSKPRHQNAHLTVYRNRVFVKATKNIRNNKEIFCSYGRGGYKNDEEGVVHSTTYVR